MNPVVSILIVVTLINLVLSGVVLKSKPQAEVNRVFSLFALAIGFWTLTNAFFQVATSAQSALLWANLSYGSALLIAAAFLHFAWIYPHHRLLPAHSNRAKWLLWTAALILALLPFVPGAVIGAVDLSANRRILTNAGVYPIALFLLGAALWSFKTLFRNYSRTRGREHAQLRYVLSGAALTAGFGLSFNLLLPLLGDYRLVWLGPTSSLFLVGFTVYSIVAHRLFDIRLLIKRTVVYALLLGTLIAAFSAIVLGLTAVLQAWAGLHLPDFAANIAGAVLIGFGVDPLRRRLDQATDSFFFRSEQEQQTVLKELAVRLNDAVALDDALDTLLQTVTKTLRVQRAALYVFERGEDGEIAVKRIRQIGIPSQAQLFFTERDGALPFFARSAEMMVLEPTGHKTGHTQSEIPPPVLHKLRSLQAALALPLHLNHQLVGLLLAGSQQSGEMLSPDHLSFLETVGAQAISAIQKARLLEGDQQKSEFVSIASHELLTPISAIEGYLSMILEENIGTPQEQRAYLEKVYGSAKRLGALVKDLLSVSRLEAGRFKVVPQETSLEKLIQDTLDQLKFVARDKKLRLSYDKPAHPLPLVWADPDRTVQVLMNLVGNAIKYTPKGSVTISATLLKGATPQVQVTIADTGLGMSKDAQAHLFEKFYRVSTPQTSGIQGTGLGLYITKAIIEKMGGRLSVESTPGQGSQFRFTLPCSPV